MARSVVDQTILAFDEVTRKRNAWAVSARWSLREAAHRLVEIRARYRFGAPKSVGIDKGREAQGRRSLCDLDLPDPVHHELEEGRLDAPLGLVATCRSIARARALGSETDLTDGNLVEDGVDEGVFDTDATAAELLDRLDDRVAGGRPAEMLDVEPVREERRDPSLEAVEPGEGVLADRDEEVDRKLAPVDGPRELDGEGAFAVLVRTRDEVLLDLIEDHEQDAVAVLCPGLECGREAAALGERGGSLGPVQVAHGLPDRLREPGDRVLTPVGQENRDVARRLPGGGLCPSLLQKVGEDARAKQGALAHSARAVKKREPRGS